MNATPALILFGVLLALILIGFPISHSFVLAVFVTVVYLGKTSMLPGVMQRVVVGMDSYPLIAVPFFVLSGALMESSGISTRLVNFLKMLLRWLPAATCCITVGASAFFGAISGSAAATCAAIGGVVMPTMRKIGYEDKDIAAVTGCSGILGALIPPSIPMMMYAITAQTSIGDMFIAGILPGLVLAVVFIIVSIFMYRKIEGSDKTKMTAKEVGKTTIDAIPAIIMPVIILGGIYSGVFTATEAAATAVIYALLVGMILYRTLTPKVIMNCLISSARFTACVFFMIGCTSTFTWLLASTGLSQTISNAILSAFSSKIAILLMINIILLVLGCFMDTIAIVLLMTPVLVPICAGVGVNLTHLGIILIINTCLGMITPPLGTNLLMSTQMCGMKSLAPSLKPAMMYVVAGIVVMMVFTYCEPLALLLVS